MGDDPARLYRLDGVAHIAGVINEEVITEITLFYRLSDASGACGGSRACSSMTDTFRNCRWPLLGVVPPPSQVQKWSGYNPSSSEKGPKVQMWRLWIDRLQDREFIWMPYSNPDVLQVVHPEVLEPRHMALWRSVTSLIYFAVIEWHQIDRVLPQFGGVQPRPHPALNIDFLMSKDGRGGDRWFPYHLQKWHLHWESRAESVLRFDVVADPGPSHEFLEWWS
ncbi:hypothetical protein Ahy_B10g101978 [Arachis hypogaea]|uniref:Aminotransferase-like plant mobile domain-containing protein n=1 Tax=Arachis hypogaea TaxID=3818 RepID=A0A444X0V1_ARAHY|nr:hypothetical protein Ahy_B10g101978 [Arachis hypogaea]